MSFSFLQQWGNRISAWEIFLQIDRLVYVSLYLVLFALFTLELDSRLTYAAAKNWIQNKNPLVMLNDKVLTEELFVQKGFWGRFLGKDKGFNASLSLLSDLHFYLYTNIFKSLRG